MVASLSVGTPVITWASDTETTEQKSAESDTIEVSVKSPTPVIWDEEDVIVKVQDTHYDDNSGNSFYQIEFMVENNSSVDVRIGGGNSCIDDFQVPDYTGSSSVIAGKKGICDESIWTKDFSKAGIDDFEIHSSARLQSYIDSVCRCLVIQNLRCSIGIGTCYGSDHMMAPLFFSGNIKVYQFHSYIPA